MKNMKYVLGNIRFHLLFILNMNRVYKKGIKYYIGKNIKMKLSKGELHVNDKLFLEDNCMFELVNKSEIRIGFNNFFNRNCLICSMNTIVIGDNNLFGPNVCIYDHNHKYDDRALTINRQGYTLGSVKIGDGNWIAANTVILANSEIGDHVIVAANSVVKGKLDSYAIYAGNPAVKVKDL